MYQNVISKRVIKMCIKMCINMCNVYPNVYQHVYQNMISKCVIKMCYQNVYQNVYRNVWGHTHSTDSSHLNITNSMIVGFVETPGIDRRYSRVKGVWCIHMWGGYGQ